MVDKSIRLHKLLARSGVASLRKAEDLIAQGRVKVNGQVITTQGYQASMEDVILVDDKPIKLEDFEYYVLYKPLKTISTVVDDRNRKDVVSLIATSSKIFPIGRLDKDTTGLLLLTNDGEFAHKMMHPSFRIEKSYQVTVKGKIDKQKLDALAQGVLLDDQTISDPAVIESVTYDKRYDRTILKLTITQGKNRIVRRMMTAIDKEVHALHRYRYGSMTLQDLSYGQYRKLKTHEIKQLKKLADSR